MKNRCNSPDGPLSKWYYTKGIRYDPRWESFDAFFEDMGLKPDDTHLDRIDGNKGYSKDNCRWATYRVSFLNRGSNKNKFKLPAGIRINAAGNYAVRAKYKGKELSLGTYADLDTATQVRKEWEGLHDN
jgi:hypothetical protein